MTTEPIDVLVAKALIARVTTQALTSPATPIANPYVAYTPTVNVAYLDIRPVLRADPENPGIAFDGSSIFRGVFQVDAVMPDGAGESPGLRLASLVAARFAVGTKLVAGSYFVKCNKIPTIAAAVKDAPWVRFPVSIPFVVITP